MNATIISFLFAIALMLLITKYLQHTPRLSASLKAIDALHKEIWTGQRGDELLSWYRVRSKVMNDMDITHRERQSRLDALNIRIEQCYQRNKTWTHIARKDGRIHIISTQN